MAKIAKLKAANITLLAAIASAPEGFLYVSQTEAAPLLGQDPAMIEVNTNMLDPNDNTKAAARVTEAGKALVASKSNGSTPTNEAPPMEQFAIITGAVLPPSKRGNRGGGAPTKYPFDKLEVGQTFFVGKSDEHPNPLKTLGSTVSSANNRYAEKTTETKQVERTKRGAGNKAVKNADGSNVKESVTVPVMKFTRKFSIRAVEAGKSYGAWTAPADGVLIGRDQ